jgi:hypothetical protein
MSIQEYYFILTILFLAGFVGWGLFAYTLFKTIYSRRIEIEMIEDISSELKKVKDELQTLK